MVNDTDVPLIQTVRNHRPGLTVTALATLAAAYVSVHYGVPLTLMSFLFGLPLHFLGTDPRLAPGLTFASRTLLRWGVALVAVRVTVTEIAELGLIALLVIIAIVTVTLAAESSQHGSQAQPCWPAR